MTMQSILHYMQHNAEQNANGSAFAFIGEDGTNEALSHRQLWEDVCKVADYLRASKQPGSRILLFYPAGLEYVKVFYGCLLAGMVAVPLYPPRKNVKSDRILKVAESCTANFALTSASELENVKAVWQNENQSEIQLEICALNLGQLKFEGERVIDLFGADQPAFLQYTSGSTGTPKGVTITHGNILANMRHLEVTSSGNQRDVFVNWLPLFHDMGLVVTVLWPVYLGTLSVLMAPATFVRNPLCWLKAIHHYRGTICGAPNFAYDLCVEKINDTELRGLDLSSWRIAFNSAEPVRHHTMTSFSQKFAHCGFGEQTFYPAYGMAEATVFISGGTVDEHPLSIAVDKGSLAEHKLVSATRDSSTSTRLVGCGRVCEPHDLKIVDPKTFKEVEAGQVGEIWFHGPSVSPRYWGLEEVTAATFEQRIQGDRSRKGYLRTGDLGAVLDDQVFVTGRMKDLIIFRGRNYYPQDLEDAAASAHVAVRRGHCAAFSVEQDNTLEKLVLVAELERHHFRSVDLGEVCSAIRRRAFIDFDVSIDEVVLLKPYKIPVTSSGKIRRKATREMFLNGELEVIQSTILPVREYIAPESEVEKNLCEIWRRVLKHDRVGTHDNFFDLGGNSLVAIEISSQVKRMFQDVELDIAQLLEMPTVAKMAQFINIRYAYQQNLKRLNGDQTAEAVIEI